ncbi:Major Facilitator Superfamily [Snodgrassella alvi SCGC AB-598-O11]|nr:Major Facilitator Superfamily [Snodgrassella alvi SCGC AB-598-O11]
MSLNSNKLPDKNKNFFSDNHKWKVLFTGAFANTCFTFVIGGVPAASIILRNDYHIPTSVLGLLMGIVGFGIAVSELPWGIATDRFGDRPILIAGLSTTAIALFILAYFARISSHTSISIILCAGLLVVGLFGSSVNGSSGKAIIQWFKPQQRGLAMSVRQAAVPLGYALGALFYPYISIHYGFSTI